MQTRGYKRRFFRTTKYQRPFLNLIISLAIVTLAMMTTCAAFLYYDIATFIQDPESTIGTIKATIFLLLIILPLLLLLGIFWAYNISHRLIGPFERIIRELDDVIKDNKKTHIRTRKGDTLAEELLRRVNYLIDRMS